MKQWQVWKLTWASEWTIFRAWPASVWYADWGFVCAIGKQYFWIFLSKWKTQCIDTVVRWAMSHRIMSRHHSLASQPQTFGVFDVLHVSFLQVPEDEQMENPAVHSFLCHYNSSVIPAGGLISWFPVLLCTNQDVYFCRHCVSFGAAGQPVAFYIFSMSVESGCPENHFWWPNVLVYSSKISLCNKTRHLQELVFVGFGTREQICARYTSHALWFMMLSWCMISTNTTLNSGNGTLLLFTPEHDDNI